MIECEDLCKIDYPIPFIGGIWRKKIRMNLGLALLIGINLSLAVKLFRWILWDHRLLKSIC